MSTKTSFIAATGLLASRALAFGFTTLASDVNWDTDNGPYGLSGKIVKDSLANPVATHSFPAIGPNGTSNFTYTITVADLPLDSLEAYKDKNLSVADAAISLSGPSPNDTRVAGWQICHQFMAPEYNQTFIDLFSASDDGDCTSAFSDECLSKLRSQSCVDSFVWPSECPYVDHSVAGWTDNTTVVLEADAWVNYYGKPHDGHNKTEATNLSNMVFPILTEWTHASTKSVVRGVQCVRANVPSPTPTGPATGGTTTTAPTTTHTSSFAGPTAGVKKEYLLGAAAAAAAYMAC